MLRAMLLEAQNLDVRYGRVRALSNVSVCVTSGEIVAVLGANGAGKSSLLRGLAGLERAAGRVVFEGQDISALPAYARARRGLVLVPEGRRIVMGLTVEENLLMGADNRRDKASVQSKMRELYERFPNLAARRDKQASVLSGGEQQMLAIGRALLATPKVMMLDEPSLGLSPKLSSGVFELIPRLAQEEGIAILLVEQNTDAALRLASRAYVLELGKVVKSGASKDVLADSSLQEAYLGSRHGVASKTEIYVQR